MIFVFLQKNNNMPQHQLLNALKDSLKTLYNIDPESVQLSVEKTNPEFEGDYTFVVFPYLKISRKSPEQTAGEIGKQLLSQCEIIASFNVIKGFLNILLKDSFWIQLLAEHVRNSISQNTPSIDKKPPVLIEYSSPNTNKPLHLGHIRNNLIGHSLAAILKATGHNVVQVNLINDRGIHICKTMLAWMKWENGSTPTEKGLKGDVYVGGLYVKFESELKKELNVLQNSGLNEEDAMQQSVLMSEARQLLRMWEDGDEQTRKVWKMMNDWVLEGFDKTYTRMGIHFDKLYFESETYLWGKKIVNDGVEKDVFNKKEDSSVWADLRNDGLDEKLLLRSDGTTVYMTQDIGTAVKRQEEWNPSSMLYVVGNEQNYHFQVLKLVLKKLGFGWSDTIQHVSYGMVELPDGKMKSREGKVVDADELMNEMYQTAEQISTEAGKASGLEPELRSKILEMIAQAALKYFILRVDAKKNMVFNPTESIDFNGNTGPFVQYTHARIVSLVSKSGVTEKCVTPSTSLALESSEKKLIQLLTVYQDVLAQSAEELNPAVIAQYAYELAKEYNSFYQSLPVLKEENQDIKNLRILISQYTAVILEKAFGLLGIQMPGVM